jgi:two-component system response regulator VanR
LAPQTILLVDDEKDIIDLLEIYLKNEGYRLLRAGNGLEDSACCNRKRSI